MEEDWKAYNNVIERFDGFFKVWKNVIFERECISKQQAGGSAEQFITSLYKFAKDCSYVEMKEKMITRSWYSRLSTFRAPTNGRWSHLK